MVLPVHDSYVTEPYGVKGTMWQIGHHTGIDYHAPVGTPVFATRGGTVIHTGWGGWGQDYGNHIILRVRTPWGRTREVLYAHLSGDDVHVGEKVKAGDRIGRSGATGNVTGPHLHYEERVYPFRYGNDRRPSLPQWKPLFRPHVRLHNVQPGKRNNDVKKVQRHLNRRLEGKDLPVTGYFGPLTKFNYSRWQGHLGYSGKDANGVPGKTSLRKLGFRVS